MQVIWLERCVSENLSLSIKMVIFPDKPGSGLAGYIGAKDDGSGGDNWSCKTSSQIAITNKPTPTFL